MTELIEREVEATGQEAPRTEAAPTVFASNLSAEDRRKEAVRMAGEISRQRPDWVTFFREILGVEGVVCRLFPTVEELREFGQTAEYREVQQMLAKLRERSTIANDTKEPTKVITVRLPKSLHESLRQEAHSKQTSINQLCISKLLQVIDNELVPTE